MRQVTRQLPEVFDAIGSAVRLVELGDGWPSIIDVRLPSGVNQRIYLHASIVSSHSRGPFEYRFQNPAMRTPVSTGPGAIPILAGLHLVDGNLVLVVVDGRSRLGRVARFSILFDIRIAQEAVRLGWASYRSGTGEEIYAISPALFPTYVELIRSGATRDISDAENRSIQVAVSASGLLEENTEEASERARRAASVLIRGYAFGGQVVRAYNGQCAMCGLNTGLVVGAHIRPVAAQGSPDSVWNGVALCHNHHAAFDLHKIWVSPETRQILFHPLMLDEAESKPALAGFLNSTYDTLAAPQQTAHLPRSQMFVERYTFFGQRYDWAA